MKYPEIQKEVSYPKLLGQLQDKGNTDLIKSYSELYESAYLMKAIQKFSGNAIRKKTSSPKILTMAPAFASFYRINSLTEDDKGKIFKSAVGAELIKAQLNPYYWADGDYEVDFVLQYKKNLIEIEVKSGKMKRSASIQLFLKKYPTAKIILINKENFIKFSEDIGMFLDKNI